MKQEMGKREWMDVGKVERGIDNAHSTIHNFDSLLLKDHQPSSSVIPPRLRDLPNDPRIKPRYPQTLNQKLLHVPRLHQRRK